MENSGEIAKPSSSPEGEKKGYKSVQFKGTPNVHASQFIINKEIAAGAITIDSPEKAKGDVFAETLFKIPGIENIFIKGKFITVSKSPEVAWIDIVYDIEQIIEDHLTHYEIPEQPGKLVTAPTSPNPNKFNAEEFLNFSDQEKGEIVDTIFERTVRPPLNDDGGDVILLGVKGNKVQIRYQGACGNCPGSTQGTLQFIETLLKEHVHPDLQVEVQ